MPQGTCGRTLTATYGSDQVIMSEREVNALSESALYYDGKRAGELIAPSHEKRKHNPSFIEPVDGRKKTKLTISVV